MRTAPKLRGQRFSRRDGGSNFDRETAPKAKVLSMTTRSTSAGEAPRPKVLSTTTDQLRQRNGFEAKGSSTSNEINFSSATWLHSHFDIRTSSKATTSWSLEDSRVSKPTGSQTGSPSDVPRRSGREETPLRSAEDRRKKIKWPTPFPRQSR